MTDVHGIIAVAIMSLVTILLRFLPFWVLGGKKIPAIVDYLGKVLPYAIMTMLVVYCLKETSFTTLEGWVPAAAAVVITVLSYVWKKNTLISIGLGTISYMLLIQFVF